MVRGKWENGKIQKWDGFMEKWEIFVMNEWVRWAAELLVENNRTKTEIRRQRGWHGHDILPLPSLPSLSPHPSPPKKKQGTDEVAIAYSCKVFDVFKYLSVFSPWGGGREGRAAHRLQNPVIDSCLGIWFTELKPDVRWSNWKSTYTTNIY